MSTKCILIFKKNDTEMDSYYSLDNNLSIVDEIFILCEELHIFIQIKYNKFKTTNRRLKNVFSINVHIICLTTNKISK